MGSQKKSKIKVLTLINAFELGGIEKTFLGCIPHLQEREIQVEVCCFSKQGILLEDFERHNVQIHQIRKTRSIFFDFIQLFFLLIKIRPEIVHSRFGFTSGGFCLASRMAGIPCIVSLHSTNASVSDRIQKMPIVNRLVNLQLKVHGLLTRHFSSLIMGHSRANLNANYKNWEDNSKFRLVYNGIDFKDDEAEGFPEYSQGADLCILHIGSFRHAKNHEFLLRTFMELNPVENNYRLILVGDGALRSHILALVEAHGLINHVLMPGLDTDLEKYFAAADLFYFPSRYEGFANVLVEAQYKELPICGSGIAALYESVFPAYHRFFFDPTSKEDAVASLRNIIKCIEMDELRNEIKEAKKFAFDNFGIEKMADHLAVSYRDLTREDSLNISP